MAMIQLVCQFCLLQHPHPQSAGTIKSQHWVGTRKRPPQKTITSDREITCVLERNYYIFCPEFFFTDVCPPVTLSWGVIWGNIWGRQSATSLFRDEKISPMHMKISINKII